MRTPSSFKQIFLKKWIENLHICNSSNKNMKLFEKKKAIKLSADIAMAYAKKGTTYWSRAILSNPSESGKIGSNITSMMANKRVRSKKIMKKSSSIIIRSVQKRIGQRVEAKSIANRLVRKRMKILKKLVPGGESMDGNCLIEETLDYIVSLHAQVDVMQFLVNLTQKGSE